MPEKRKEGRKVGKKAGNLVPTMYPLALSLAPSSNSAGHNLLPSYNHLASFLPPSLSLPRFPHVLPSCLPTYARPRRGFRPAAVGNIAERVQVKSSSRSGHGTGGGGGGRGGGGRGRRNEDPVAVGGGSSDNTPRRCCVDGQENIKYSYDCEERNDGTSPKFRIEDEQFSLRGR